MRVDSIQIEEMLGQLMAGLFLIGKSDSYTLLSEPQGTRYLWLSFRGRAQLISTMTLSTPSSRSLSSRLSVHSSKNKEKRCHPSLAWPRMDPWRTWVKRRTSTFCEQSSIGRCILSKFSTLIKNQIDSFCRKEPESFFGRSYWRSKSSKINCKARSGSWVVGPPISWAWTCRKATTII